MPKRKKEEQQTRRKKSKINSEQEEGAIQTWPSNASVVSHIFRFFDDPFDLVRVSRVNKFWHELSAPLLSEIRKSVMFSILLRGISFEKISLQTVKEWLEKNSLKAANIRVPSFQYAIGIHEYEKLVNPTLLYDLAHWFPSNAQEIADYKVIFSKLLQGGADPTISCTVQVITKTDATIPDASITVTEKSEKSVFSFALSMLNVEFISVWLDFYSQHAFHVEKPEQLLEEVLEDYKSMVNSPLEPSADSDLIQDRARIIDKMLDCGFVPTGAMLKKYQDLEIKLIDKSTNEITNLALKLKILCPDLAQIVTETMEENSSVSMTNNFQI